LFITFFTFKTCDNGLTEHEFDHVMVGNYNDAPNINQEEVASWKWMPLEGVKADIIIHPELYTEWFKIIFDKFYDYINLNKS